jgi:hypothetical protein
MRERERERERKVVRTIAGEVKIESGEARRRRRRRKLAHLHE